MTRHAAEAAPGTSRGEPARDGFREAVEAWAEADCPGPLDGFSSAEAAAIRWAWSRAQADIEEREHEHHASLLTHMTGMYKRAESALREDTALAHEETVAYTRYEWDCPRCGDVQDAGDVDPQGETCECAACGAQIYVRETR